MLPAMNLNHIWLENIYCNTFWVKSRQNCWSGRKAGGRWLDCGAGSCSSVSSRLERQLRVCSNYMYIVQYTLGERINHQPSRLPLVQLCYKVVLLQQHQNAWEAAMLLLGECCVSSLLAFAHLSRSTLWVIFKCDTWHSVMRRCRPC